MITHIQITERGPTPGILKREFNRVSKQAWFDAAAGHHTENTAKRFTPAHARAAKYSKRKGENMPRGTKAFNRSYYGRKLRSSKGGGVGRADPLVFSGATRDRAKFASISSTAGRARIRYNTPALNFRHPKSRVRMREEFTRILPSEQQRIAESYDTGLQSGLDRVSDEKRTTIS